jgi:CRP-like cAMP-binding protein
MEGIRQDLTELLERIPNFDGLSVDECKRVLSIGEQVRITPGKTIYPANTPGSQMMILLLGTVSIQTSEGKEIAQVEEVDTVGEMEIFTAPPRVAKVVASTEVSGLAIAKNGLDALIGSDPNLGVQILKNIIDSLGRKLATANARASALPPATPTSEPADEPPRRNDPRSHVKTRTQIRRILPSKSHHPMPQPPLPVLHSNSRNA